MYFKSREAAGRLLAEQIAKKYGDDACVIALSDGSTVVGAQIAQKLRTVIMLLMTAPIELPREPKPIGAITASGSFVYNNAYSSADITEMTTEYRNHIELEKIRRINEMHRASGEGDLIRKDLLRDKTVILVSDGLQDGFAVDLAFEFLKPIRTKKIVIATPLANVSAVDRMHIQADEIFCLNVVKDYFSTDHYYDAPDVPEHEVIIKTIENVIAAWVARPSGLD
jgi:putative phosphoribosyl transferase